MTVALVLASGPNAGGSDVELYGQLAALGGIPRPNDLAASEKAFFDLFATPAAQARIKDLLDRGLQEDGDLERNLGDRLGPVPVAR